ncbi:MAG: hypothetical protein ACUVTX_05960, partial [Bacteroidales bacterium]
VLVVINAVWCISEIVLKPDISLWPFMVISFLFFITSSIFLFIFFRGQNRKLNEETIYTFISVSLKFILELFVAFIWFALMKKTGLVDILLFFVLYLAFSMISILIVLKSLKNKILKD